MALMLRTVGIPSRIVNGFLQGEYNSISGNYTVRTSDAHSWVEVYFPGYGWVSFDPTPADGRTLQESAFGRLSLYADAFQSVWEEWVINYDFLHQITLARQLEGTSREMGADSRQFFRRHYRSTVNYAAQFAEWVFEHGNSVAAILGLSVVCLWTLLARGNLRRWIREQAMIMRSRRGMARPEDATVVYLRLLHILHQRGIRKARTQTPGEFAALVPEPVGKLVRDFTNLYVEARFGKRSHLLPRLTEIVEKVKSSGRGKRAAKAPRFEDDRRWNART